jgi:hypothetical protein
MVTPDTLSLWLKEQSWPLAIIAVLVLGAFLTLKYSARRRREVMNRERSGVTEETFVDHLAQYHFDPVITGTTYRYLQEAQLVPFPILPGDALDEDLGLDSEDVEQSVSELLASLNREEAPGLRHEPLVTVEDLVRHLQASPRKAQSAAA